jgi:hypothetical protein
MGVVSSEPLYQGSAHVSATDNADVYHLTGSE